MTLSTQTPASKITQTLKSKQIIEEKNYATKNAHYTSIPFVKMSCLIFAHRSRDEGYINGSLYEKMESPIMLEFHFWSIEKRRTNIGWV